MPAPDGKARPPRSESRSSDPCRPAVDGGRYRGQAHRRRRGRRLGRRLPRRPRAPAAPWSATAARASAAGSEAHDAADRRERDGVRWAGCFEVDGCGRWQYAVEAWIDRLRHLARRDRAQGRRRAGRPRRRAVRGPVLARARARARATASRTAALLEHVLAEVEDRDPGDREARPGARTRAARGDRARRGAPRRRPREPLTIDVDRERARFGSWYELFPRSWGGFDGVGAQLPQLAELGFDVVYLPPIHPIGLTNRKGREQRARRRARAIRAARGRSARELGGHDAVAPRARRRSTTSKRWSRAPRAGHRDRARLRDPVLGRPPVAEASTRSGSTAAPTAR